VKPHALTAGIVIAALCAAGAVGAADPRSSGGAQPAPSDCPRRAQPLEPSALAPASRAALRSQRERYEELGTRPLAARAAIADFDEVRGAEVRRDCGRRAERRTVVVYLEAASAPFRRGHPSLSQGVVFVSRFPGDGHRVWRVVR
jgi:hypothetical protein